MILNGARCLLAVPAASRWWGYAARKKIILEPKDNPCTLAAGDTKVKPPALAPDMHATLAQAELARQCTLEHLPPPSSVAFSVTTCQSTVLAPEDTGLEQQSS